MENLIDPAKLCFDDVQCQCRALAFAAYKIEDEDVRELLLYTLMEKQQQLDMLLPANTSKIDETHLRKDLLSKSEETL